jgi:hypothetical protein
MSEFPQEAFDNPTLGEATTAPFLDQLEAQNKEDFNARHEGREPRTVSAVNRFPQFMPAGSVPSSVQPELAFSDAGETNPDEDSPVAEDDFFNSEDFENDAS